MIRQTLKKTAMTRLGRSPKHGSFDRAQINEIIDATPLCHLGQQTNGQTVVIPTCHWRIDNHIYWHGSKISRSIIDATAHKVCLTVTHLDGLVLARSGFHHSANYRSVMIFGTPEVVDAPEQKLSALQAFIEGLFPGRWAILRAPSRKEMNATTVLRIPIDEASAKIRSGPPIDHAGDETLPIWAGVVPITQQVGEPVPCANNQAKLKTPKHVTNYRIGE